MSEEQRTAEKIGNAYRANQDAWDEALMEELDNPRMVPGETGDQVLANPWYPSDRKWTDGETAMVLALFHDHHCPASPPMIITRGTARDSKSTLRGVKARVRRDQWGEMAHNLRPSDVRRLLSALPAGLRMAQDDEQQADPDAGGGDTGALDELVTLDQCAAIVSGSKRTLERYRHEGKIPAPDFPGGGGKAHRWRWSTIRPALEEHCRAELPEQFPASRIV